jgi:hypothetical protein
MIRNAIFMKTYTTTSQCNWLDGLDIGLYVSDDVVLNEIYYSTP